MTRNSTQDKLIRREYLAIDLFSGAGGVTEGLKQAGFHMISAVENNRLAVNTYMKNHPEVFLWEESIENIKIGQFMDVLGIEPGEIDLLAGCPPCQGYSSLRTLNGSREIVDKRNSLVFEFVRFADGLKPKVIMMENVPELAQDHRMDKIISILNEIGYYSERENILKILNAEDFGVAQRRKRMILMSGMMGAIDFPKPNKEKLFVQDIISDLPPAGQSGDPLHDYPERRSKRILDIISRIPRDGGSRLDLAEKYQLDCHKNCDGFKDVYGRMKWDDVAPTITSGCTNPSKGRFLHPEENRAITLREAALLQSFPIEYYFSLDRGKTGASSLIGNALPPKLIESLASEVKNYLKDNNTV